VLRPLLLPHLQAQPDRRQSSSGTFDHQKAEQTKRNQHDWSVGRLDHGGVACGVDWISNSDF